MKRLLCAGLIGTLFGCFYRSYDFYYASLGAYADAVIISRKRILAKDLTNNSVIPIEYQISRNEYVITFQIEDDNYFPHFLISVVGVGDKKLSIKPNIDLAIVSKDGVICPNYFLDSENASSVKFIWSYGCFSDDIQKVISFDLIDSSGTPVASEAIPFTVVRDGKFRAIDAI